MVQHLEASTTPLSSSDASAGLALARLRLNSQNSLSFQVLPGARPEGYDCVIGKGNGAKGSKPSDPNQALTRCNTH